MRRALSGELRKQFEVALKSYQPCFRRSNGSFPGDRRFEWNAREQLTVYVELTITEKDDAFTVEVGWSERGEYPGDLDQLAGWLFDDPERGIVASEIRRGGLRFRVGSLLRPPRDYWWDVVAGRAGEFAWHGTERRVGDGERNIGTCVRDAVRMVSDSAIPYVEMRTGVSLTGRS